jgi:hypothetical protein
MLEADLADGDFSQITQAITNALKPVSAPQRQIGGATAPRFQSTPDVEAEEVEAEAESEQGEYEAPPRSVNASSNRPRIYKEPKRLDIDLSAFKDFATAKNPEGTMDRHLVAAVWFKMFFNTPAVTIDHIYSAYLEAGWSTNLQDFDDPLRKLVGKKKGLMKRVGKAEYEATFPGMNAVRGMGQPVVEP